MISGLRARAGESSPFTVCDSPISITKTDQTTRHLWDRYVAAAPEAELYHDFRWKELVQDLFGHESLYLVARDSSEQLRGVLPLVRLKSHLFGDFLVSLPYFNYAGVLADSTGIRDALLRNAAKCAGDLGVSHIELRHRDVAGIEWPARLDKVSMLLDLPESVEDLWKGYRPKLRSQIRRAAKEGAGVLRGGSELLDDFYKVFSRNMRDLGTPVYPKKFFAEILRRFSAESTLIIVQLNGKPVAGAMLLAHRGTLEIPWASSLRTANRFGVNMLLYSSALDFAIESGSRRFDFGRSTKDSGTYRFKLQWGASPQLLNWHYWLAPGRSLPRLTPNNPKYRLAVACWQRLPVSMTNLLGPSIVKNLP